MIVPLHPCIGHQMQEVQLDAINFIISHTTANIFHHHLMRLPRKAIDQMGDDLCLRHLFTNTLDCFNIEIITMGPIDQFRRRFISRLKTQLNRHMHALCQLC